MEKRAFASRKDVPTAILEAAKYYIERYGMRLERIEDDHGTEGWLFSFPDDEEIGIPPVFYFDGAEVKEDTLIGDLNWLI